MEDLVRKTSRKSFTLINDPLPEEVLIDYSMPLPLGIPCMKKHYPTLQGACTLLQGTCAPAAGSYAPATGNMTSVHAPAARNVDRIDIPATGVYAPAAGVGMPLPQGIRDVENVDFHDLMPLLLGIRRGPRLGLKK
jgi:hypothetical protein